MLKLILLAALALQHTPYAKLNCWKFINTAAHSDCGAALLSTTCGGKLTVVYSGLSTAELVTLEGTLQAGDIAQFHGGHVSMYLGHGTWIDSTRKRNGVAQFKMADELVAGERGWYGGPIQIVRWRNL